MKMNNKACYMVILRKRILYGFNIIDMTNTLAFCGTQGILLHTNFFNCAKKNFIIPGQK